MKEEFFILNGLIKRTNEPSLFINNRAFLYADGFFESIYAFNNNLPFLNLHLNRINKALTVFHLNNIPIFQNIDELKKIIIYLARKNKLYKAFRVRINIFREAGGLVKPENNNINYIISTSKLPFEKIYFNNIGLKLDIFDDIKKEYSTISPFKTINPSSVIAMNYAAKHNLDDIIFLNSSNNIVETSNSNIFIFYNNTLFTPEITEGCVDGIMRHIIINIAKELNINVVKTQLNIDILNSAQEIILTNAIQGIRFVAALKNKRYLYFLAKKLSEKLLEIYF